MLSVDARNLLEEAASLYQQAVDHVGPYLASRGITRQVADTVRLGYVTPDNAMVGHEQYVGRLSIPFLTPSGCIDIRWRSITDDDSPKYLSRAGADPHLYNVLAFQEDSDVIAICEGEIDTITAHYLCGIPTVGLPGANSWKPFYSRAFADYRKVLVLSDGDQAGRDLGKRIAQQIDVAMVVSMPDGQDVNSIYMSEGIDGVRKRVGL